MSISGASGDHNHATTSAVGLAALRISSPEGNDCQKFFTQIDSPPWRSPAKARPAARLPESENSHVLRGLVRLEIVKPSGFAWVSLKSFQIAFLSKTGLPLNCSPVSCAT